MATKIQLFDGDREKYKVVNSPTQGTFNGPTVSVDASGDCVFTNAGNLGPLNEWERFAATINKTRASAVLGLLFASCPAAIIGFVSSVVVFSVNGMACTRPMTHVGKEVGKRFSPSTTNSDPPASVVGEVFSFGPFAPSDHVPPRPVFNCSASAMRFVCGRTVFGLFQKATAASCVSGSEFVLSHYRTPPALAETSPQGFSPGHSRVGSHAETGKCFADLIDGPISYENGRFYSHGGDLRAATGDYTSSKNRNNSGERGTPPSHRREAS